MDLIAKNDLKNLISRSANVEMFVLLKTKNVKDKEKLADKVGYFHMMIIVNFMLSITRFYNSEYLHDFNLVLLSGVYTDWFTNAYYQMQYNVKDECILTRIENTLRSEAVRERNYSKKALEVKEKPKLKNGYIKTIVFNLLGVIIPDKAVNIVIHSIVGMSLYNSYFFE